jgi:hypothetical protein
MDLGLGLSDILGGAGGVGVSPQFPPMLSKILDAPLGLERLA